MQIKSERGNCAMILDFDFKDPIPLQDLLCDFERMIIGTFIMYHKGNKSHTAASLSLNRTTLVMKAAKYGFPPGQVVP